MLSCTNDNTLALARAEILAAIGILAAQGATVAELVDGIMWARAVGLVSDADALLEEIVVRVRAGRLLSVDVLTLCSHGRGVYSLAVSATDTDGREWAAGTFVAPLATGQRDDLPGCPLYQSVTIDGAVRTFLEARS